MLQLTDEFLQRLHLEKRVEVGHLAERSCCNSADRVGETFGMNGIRTTISNACASGGAALGLGSDLLESGERHMATAQ